MNCDAFICLGTDYKLHFTRPSQVASASQASYGNVKFEIKIVRKYNMLLSFLSIVDI